ncbi:conserved hypothetical protein [Methylocella silvestris BL2]|uniref:CoxB-like protein n=2 Tax=Methylocella silvestris TaxID=199596 RepID=B8EST7_METSB|nr:conserved hypothetical protein [Methylocella silvestris BL2]
MNVRNKIIATTVGALSLCGGATASIARSELIPGVSAGIPLGAPLPQGIYAVSLPSFGYRNSVPGQSVGALMPAWMIWSTPWDVLGGHVMFDFATPMANVNIHDVLNKGGFLNPLVGAHLNWDLGGGFFGGFIAGVYFPLRDSLSSLGATRNFASFQGAAALSYLANGWNISATFIYGTGQNGNPLDAGSWGTNWINVDLTATHKFGKFEIGAVGFGSADLDSPYRGYQQQSQFAVGGLVGYDFGSVNLQLKLTRDVAQTNYGGHEIRGWVNIIIPLWVADPPPAAVAAKF